MEWKDVLSSRLSAALDAVDRLLARVNDDDLGWKPASGDNWMTVGQLIEHIVTINGMTFQGFITGDWPVPEGMTADELENMSMEEMLPPAEQMPTVASVAEARTKLAADRAQALAALEKLAESQVAEPAPAGWDPTPLPLAERLITLLEHLDAHKAQLFYYLKLQGHPVGTMDLY